MNSRTLTFVSLGLAGLLAGASAVAQETPIGAEQANPANTQEIGAPAQADRVIYSIQLPTVQQLTQMAQAQGAALENVNQTNNEITATYRLGDNTTRTVSYQLLPAQGAPAAVAAPSTQVVSAPPPPTPSVQVVEVAPPPPPTVVYRYYDRYDPFYYDPFYWRPRVPVSINLGFGWSHHRGHWGHRHGHWGHHRRHW
jgi:hypothetical protein